MLFCAFHVSLSTVPRASLLLHRATKHAVPVPSLPADDRRDTTSRPARRREGSCPEGHGVLQVRSVAVAAWLPRFISLTRPPDNVCAIGREAGVTKQNTKRVSKEALGVTRHYYNISLKKERKKQEKQSMPYFRCRTLPLGSLCCCFFVSGKSRTVAAFSADRASRA